MKNLFVTLLLMLSVILSLPVFAAETDEKETTSSVIVVNECIIDLSDLPVMPYQKDDILMVPLRKIGEALGYTVDWDAESGSITIDDNYIQKTVLLPNTSTVFFEGHLKVINMTRTIEIDVPVTVYNGYTYVPLTFFNEFFNDTTFIDNIISISPMKSELC